MLASSFYCAKEGSSLGCDGGGRGGGQFGARTPGFFARGFFGGWSRGAGFGRIFASSLEAVVGGGGACIFGGPGALGLENSTVICSSSWLPLELNVLFAAR